MPYFNVYISAQQRVQSLALHRVQSAMEVPHGSNLSHIVGRLRNSGYTARVSDFKRPQASEKESNINIDGNKHSQRIAGLHQCIKKKQMVRDNKEFQNDGSRFLLNHVNAAKHYLRRMCPFVETYLQINVLDGVTKKIRDSRCAQTASVKFEQAKFYAVITTHALRKFAEMPSAAVEVRTKDGSWDALMRWAFLSHCARPVASIWESNTRVGHGPAQRTHLQESWGEPVSPSDMKELQVTCNLFLLDSHTKNVKDFSKEAKAVETYARKRKAADVIRLSLGVYCFGHSLHNARKEAILSKEGLWTGVVRLAHLFGSAGFRNNFKSRLERFFGTTF